MLQVLENRDSIGMRQRCDLVGVAQVLKQFAVDLLVGPLHASGFGPNYAAAASHSCSHGRGHLFAPFREETYKLCSAPLGHVASLSTQKFSSNVMEACLERALPEVQV